MAERDVWILGASGHAKVVIATLRAAGFNPRGLYDDSPEKAGKSLLGVPVIGPIGQLESRLPGPLAHGIGSNAVRERLAKRFRSAEWIKAVHPASFVHDSVRVGPGTLIFAGAVVQPDTLIGAHAILNTGCSVDHDCRIGAFAHLAPGVRLAGGVEVGEGAFLGIGSSAIPGVSIGDWTTVGAGAVVVRSLPARVTAVGVPARARRS